MVRPLAAAGTLVRHDPDRLADGLIELLREQSTPAVSTPAEGATA